MHEQQLFSKCQKNNDADRVQAVHAVVLRSRELSGEIRAGILATGPAA